MVVFSRRRSLVELQISLAAVSRVRFDFANAIDAYPVTGLGSLNSGRLDAGNRQACVYVYVCEMG